MSRRSPSDSTVSAKSARRLAQPSGQAETTPNVSLLLRLDGVFEGLFGALLIVSPFVGLYDALALPGPASRPAVVVVGLALLTLLPVLWRASRTPQRGFVRALAIANGAGALLFSLWVLVWNATFHPAGAIFTLVVAGILAVLAILQARAAFVA